MKLVIDENIPYAKEAFGRFGDLLLLPGRKITKTELNDADILIVRSITKVNKNLLEGTRIKFIGTATIGYDHMDLDYLKESGITFTNAAGCNANSVNEYVWAAIFKAAAEKNINLADKSLGVVGVGNIGSRIVSAAGKLGFKVFQNDPPLQRKTNDEKFVCLDEALDADIITFHVPLTLEGKDKTFHLLDEGKLKLIKRGSILINSSRGPVVDNDALLKRLKTDPTLSVILDVWENEPDLNLALLEKTFLGTAHIAGYSYEGKVNGTVIIYNKLCKFLEIKPEWKPNLPPVDKPVLEIPHETNYEKTINNIIRQVYNIDEDNRALKKLLTDINIPASVYFDKLRKEYKRRREFNNYSIKLELQNEKIKKAFESLRFNSI